jgi:hypothetical protein
MTTLLLLTGAGFSRNWGGWLAREVHSDIAMRLRGNPYLSGLLQKHDNFESALEAVQSEYRNSKNQEAGQQLVSLQKAISDTFGAMNDALAKAQFEFHNDLAVSVGVFLTKFDAIFTLNQDLLIEQHYLNPPQAILSRSNPKWQLAETPGIEDIPDPNYYGHDRPLKVRRRPRQPPFTTDPRIQPYFKLHGSMNWFAQDGEQLLVMGGDKHTTMQQYPILKWYADQFSEYLSRPSSRLMVMVLWISISTPYFFKHGKIAILRCSLLAPTGATF